jgi:hypothetical protein
MNSFRNNRKNTTSSIHGRQQTRPSERPLQDSAPLHDWWGGWQYVLRFHFVADGSSSSCHFHFIDLRN